ncbi:MAG: hypothetical protein ACTSRG_15630 [Candidatus Helarchaeota archaeon]
MYPFQFKNIYAVPSFHAKIQFACEVRKLFFEIDPDIIVVELPESVREKIVEGVNHLPFISVVMYEERKKKKYAYIPIDPADSIIEAVRLGLEYDKPIKFIDLDVKNYRNKQFTFGFDDYIINKIGFRTFYELLLPYLKRSNYGTKDYNRELFMAKNLKKLIHEYKDEKILFVLGMGHWERIQGFLKREHLKEVKSEIKREKIKIFNLSQTSFIHVLREIPYITYIYELARPEIKSPKDFFDKLEAYTKLYLDAKDQYFKNFGEPVHLQKLKNILQYSRNYALVEKKIIPDLFHLVVSAKNNVDDDYAAEVYELALTYPFMDQDQKYPSVEIKKRKGELGNRSIKLKRRIPLEKTVYRKIPLKKRPKEKYKGEWVEEWRDHTQGIYSYPPEDLIFEDYMAYLRKKALKILIEDRVKIHEFKTSLMDGISIRDTIRNWHLNQKLYVREELPPKGSIGPVVCIFEEDDTMDREYTYQLDWRHEHDQESDLFIYATAPGLNIIGPGISRGEYGGFCSIFPPPEFMSIFDDEYLSELSNIRNKAGELLLKAIFLAEDHRYIVYVAKKPPDSYLRSLARKKGLYIIYIPLNELNPTTLKKIRIVHYLNSKKVRKHANKYIFL